MARVAHADRRGLGDVAQHGMGADRCLAHLDLGACAPAADAADNRLGLRFGAAKPKIPLSPFAPRHGSRMLRSRILGTGFSVPDRVVTNDELSQLMDTTDEWIRTRTGIQERHWVTEGETGDRHGAARYRAGPGDGGSPRG